MQIYDFGNDEDRPYLVMELVEGRTLGERLRDSEPLGLAASALARELLDALAHVHEAGIVHRDVKPGNVLVGTDGRARVTDFGIAQPRDATRLTNTGLVLGTMRYLAPEVLAGGAASVSSDLFALGRLLEEVLAHNDAPAKAPLRSLIQRLTEDDPEGRPASARETLTLLDAEPTAITTARRVIAEARATPVPRGVTKRSEPSAGATREARHRSKLLAGAAAGAGIRRLRDPLIALLAAGAIILAIALAHAGGEAQRPSAAPPPSAPLGQQLDGLARSLRQVGR